jgi:hypothetical protein
MIKLKHFITIFDGLDIIMVICYLKKVWGISVLLFRQRGGNIFVTDMDLLRCI